MVERLAQDIRHAARRLLASPSSTAILVLTLGLGIGATTAGVAITKGSLFRRLPYPEPDRLVSLSSSNLETGWTQVAVSHRVFEVWRSRAQSFEAISAYTWTDYRAFTVAEAGGAERVKGVAVLPNVFSTLGQRPLLGRVFLPDEARPGADKVVILAHPLWKRAFGADPSVVGRPIRVNREDHVVVGVLAEGFELPSLGDAPEILVPLVMSAADVGGTDSRLLSVAARLRPGVGPEGAGAELRAICAQLAAEDPPRHGGWSATVDAVRDLDTAAVRHSLPLFLGTAGLVWLLACANVAGMLLARVAPRRQELVVRAALGASRARLVEGLLVESLLLAAPGGGLGLLVARWGIDLVIAYRAMYLPLDKIPVDLGVLAAATGLCGLTSLACGLLPALEATKTSLVDALAQGGGRAGTGLGRAPLRDVLVSVQVALAVVLLVGAGLMLTTVRSLAGVNVGFDPRGLVSARVNLDQRRYSDDDLRSAFFRSLLDRLRSEPGVRSASGLSHFQFGGGVLGHYFHIEGQAPPDPKDAPTVWAYLALPDYFRTAGMPVLRGRGFADRETEAVAIVDETVVRKFFPKEDPLGKRLVILEPDQHYEARLSAGPRTIVGVVPEVRRVAWWWTGGAPTVYVPYDQSPIPFASLLVRSPDTGMGMGAIRRAVAALDPDLAVHQARPVQDLIDEFYGPQRFQALILGLFAGVAIFMSSLGLYTTIALAVTERTPELGVRLALGARPVQAVWVVAGRGLALVGGGLAAGLVVATGATQILAKVLYGIAPLDAMTFGVASLLVGLVAGAAILVPARRAAHLDPMVALRRE